MTTKQISSGLITSIYKSRQILLELLEKQGYNVKDYANFSINEVNNMSTNKQLDMLVEKPVEGEAVLTKMYVQYYLGKVLKEQNIQTIIEDLFNLEEEPVLTKNDILCIVIKDDINETLINLLKHIWEQDGIFIIIHSLKRLQFNILNHTLVPPHRIMSLGEIETIKKKYNITDNSLFPEISRFDPVAKSIFIRPGEVCEITRPSKSAIESFYYRVCIS
jgi:DNA-directed RNA polymerase subunit H (RpoH/RPB5)